MWVGAKEAKLAAVTTPIGDDYRPFASPGGRVFKEMLDEAGIDVTRVAFGWADDLLWTGLYGIGAQYVIAAGQHALDQWRPDLEIRQCHGRPMLIDDRIVMPVPHPESLWRRQDAPGPDYRNILHAQFANLRALALDRDNWLEYSPTSCVKCRSDDVWKVDGNGVSYCLRHAA